MKNSQASTTVWGMVASGAAAVIAVGVLLWWTQADLIGSIVRRDPGMDGYVAVEIVKVPLVTPIVGQPVAGEGAASSVVGSWPWFRGERLDAIRDDGIPLARKWPEGGPPKLWEVSMGQGFAGAAISGGCAYVLDYDEEKLADTMRCLSLDDGHEIWRNSYPVDIPFFHGMSRTVPAIIEQDGRIISFGPKCHVASWDMKTGKSHWLIDLVIDHGAEVPEWYAGQCPLIDNGRLILAPCGDSLLMAVDYRTGEVLWESPNPRGWDMTHVSIVPMEFGGKRMYVYCGTGGVAGISADDGSLLWDTTAWRVSTAACASPVPIGDGRIFFCGGYNSGAMMMRLKQAGEKFKAETVFKLRAREFSSEQHTPVLYDGHLYGVRHHSKQLVCLDLDGNERWNSGREEFGAAPYMIADGMIFAMKNGGKLTIAEATSTGYRPLAKAQVIEDGDHSWGPMAMAGGLLIVRDYTRMVCLDIRKK